MTVETVFRHIVKTGTLTVRDWNGDEHRYGDGTPPSVAIRIADRGTHLALLLDPKLALGEAYMDGRLTVESGDIHALLELLTRNLHTGGGLDLPLRKMVKRLRKFGRHLAQFNPAGRARRNVAHHYDLSGRLYDLFLDPARQYSCAYFERDDMSLAEAQQAKMRHIAAKLRIEPGMRVLDIGCGWGGMATWLARECGAQVTGITLSVEQAREARERIETAGLSGRIDIRLEDYRAVEGRFDRIVSVGMFEHVGVPHYDTFFRKMRALLEDDGIALLHHIVRASPPGSTNPWLRKYIFPGGYSPAMSEVMAPIERSGLFLADCELWRLHYAKTVAHWRAAFAQNRARAAALYDERFCRMWEFYLSGVEMSLRYGGHMVAQWQLSRRQFAVPLTRDYLHDFKAAHPLAGEEAAPEG